MKNKQLTRRILQYAAGLVCMAIGLVLLKRTNWGVSPITAVPDAVTNIFIGGPLEKLLSLGNTTILLHLVCVLMQIAVQRRVTLKSVLCMCVGIPFGKLVDLFLWLWNPTLVLWQKIVALVAGIAIQGFGVALIICCDMMLPAPDEFNAVFAQVHKKKTGNVKIVADAVYVCTALLINLFTWLLAPEKLSLSIGIASVASVFLTGRFINLTMKLFPGLKMEPLFQSTSPQKVHDEKDSSLSS